MGLREAPLVPFGPAPSGAALTFDVECRTNRRATRSKRHPMTINADWTVQTPHDLDAERVAVALGGYSSCLVVVDTAVPALREAIGLAARRVRPELHHDREAGWAVAKAAGCGCPGAFRTAAEASEHARGTRHLAARYGCSERILRMLVDATEDAVAALAQPLVDAGGLAVRELGGVARLWDAGVHPDDAVAMAGMVSAVSEPLPVHYFLGVAYCGADRDFLAVASAVRADPDTAAWLAWLPAGFWQPELTAWLRLGLARGDVLDLFDWGTDPATVGALAEMAGLPPDRVARLLAAWARARCSPSGEHLRLLVAEGLETFHPPGPALDRLEQEARNLRGVPSRTELGVMLALADTRADTLSALARGVRSAAELVAEGRSTMRQEEAG
jgi:hypothetical protein